MLEAEQCKRLKAAFENHCATTKLFRPYKANILLWLENNLNTRFDTIDDRSKVVDYIWEHLWENSSNPSQ